MRAHRDMAAEKRDHVQRHLMVTRPVFPERMPMLRLDRADDPRHFARAGVAAEARRRRLTGREAGLGLTRSADNRMR